ncbi:MAG: hypothetical protein ACLUEV_06990 [Alistipes sp.]
MKHPALAGYFLRDEPLSSDFPALGEWARKVQAVDDKHFCYLNLFPNGGKEHLDALGVQSYREYVSRFDREVQFLSFDHYPSRTTAWAGIYEARGVFGRIEKGRQGFLGVRHGYSIGNTCIRPSPRCGCRCSATWLTAQGPQHFTYWTPVNSRA